MRERAALHGGHLCADPRPEGGFAVHAVFPLATDAA
jgi:signal transduction histidine kinase